MKKTKEALRSQILKKLKYYRNSKGITLFDNPNNKLKENIVLDSNELEVLLIKMNRSTRIVVTTKYIYIICKKTNTKILGQEIDRLDYMEFINGEKIIEGKSRIQTIILRFKMNFRIGKYRIVKKNDSSIELVIYRTRFADCLNECVKKLKFIGNKYEAI